MKKNNIDLQGLINPHFEELMSKQLIRYRKDCQKWAIEFTNPAKKGHRIRKTTSWDKSHKREALKEARDLYYVLSAKGDNPALYSSRTVLEAIRRYRVMKKPSYKDNLLLNQFERVLGSRELSQLNLDDIEDFQLNEREKGNKESTITRKLDILKAVLKFAQKKKWISEIPQWEEAKYRKRQGIYLNQEMKLSLIEAMKETNNSHLIDPFLFAIATGLRKSNLINLKKENVLDEIRGRVIRLPDLEMKNGEHFTQYLSPHTDSIIKRNWHKDSRYIFKGYENRESLGDFKKCWKTVKEQAKLEHIVWHDLRHTCATEKGSFMSVPELTEFMGWKTFKMAETYCKPIHSLLRENQLKAEKQFATDLPQS